MTTLNEQIHYEEASVLLQKDRDRNYKKENLYSIEEKYTTSIEKVVPSELTEQENLYRTNGIEQICGNGQCTGVHKTLYQLLIDHFTADTALTIKENYQLEDINFNSIDEETVSTIIQDLKQYL